MLRWQYLEPAILFYGRFITRQINPHDGAKTPAHEVNDGVDYVPAKAPLLIGQHFSAIAAAGPIVGPILAGIWFGWLPAILWIIIGSIFIGGVHDYLSLIGSVRHKAASIGEIVRRYMSPGTRVFFMIFVWLALLYVIIAFTDITAQTFTGGFARHGVWPGSGGFLDYISRSGGGDGNSSVSLQIETVAADACVPAACPAGRVDWPAPACAGACLLRRAYPQNSGEFFFLCIALSHLLFRCGCCLQPRGYLGGWLLYLTIVIGLVGALLGGFKIEYPAFNVVGAAQLNKRKTAFPDSVHHNCLRRLFGLSRTRQFGHDVETT